MNYTFHPEAELEFISASDYYEQCREGLGVEFVLEVHAAIGRILMHPKAWPIVEADVRRAHVSRFPYGILYRTQEEQVYVLAVMHLHREPGSWKTRLP